jgi:hypothetical protein
MKDQYIKLIIWGIGMACVTFLIAIGKLPADALKYALLYAAGTFGGALKLPWAQDPSGPQSPSNDQPGGK